MATTDLFHYSVVHYVPDPIRDERINIGVIVVNESGNIAMAKFPRNFSRARQFGKENTGFLDNFSKSVESEVLTQNKGVRTKVRWDLSRIKKLSVEWENSIQFSSPRASTLQPDTLLNDIYKRFIIETPIAPSKPRGRPTAVKLTRQAVKNAIVKYHSNNSVKKFLKVRCQIKGDLESHKVDVVVRNGSPLLGANALSFQVKPTERFEKEVDALKWTIEDIKNINNQIQLSVITLPPLDSKMDSLYVKACSIYKKLEAEIIEEPRLDNWANKKIKELQLQ